MLAEICPRDWSEGWENTACIKSEQTHQRVWRVPAYYGPDTHGATSELTPLTSTSQSYRAVPQGHGAAESTDACCFHSQENKSQLMTEFREMCWEKHYSPVTTSLCMRTFGELVNAKKDGVKKSVKDCWKSFCPSINSSFVGYQHRCRAKTTGNQLRKKANKLIFIRTIKSKRAFFQTKYVMLWHKIR